MVRFCWLDGVIDLATILEPFTDLRVMTIANVVCVILKYVGGHVHIANKHDSKSHNPLTFSIQFELLQLSWLSHICACALGV